MEENFKTETHAEELDLIYGEVTAEQENTLESENSSSNFLKTEWRFLRKQLFSLLRKKDKKAFKTILYITLKEPPIEFINAFRKQYPDKEFKVLVPISDTEGFKKLNIDIEFFSQNQVNNAILCRLKPNVHNIEIFGLYSETFSGKDFTNLQDIVPFVKAARIAAKKLNPNIVHADGFPFFLGSELEKNFQFKPKVVQIVHDFSKFEINKKEAFWAAINLVNQDGMKKLCRDKIIKNCIATLFNLHNTKRFYQMRECLEFIYQNYYKFRKFVDKCDDIEENVLFNKMNARALKLFPQIICENDLYYNTMFQSIKRANFWAVPSETYYKNLLVKPELSGKLFERIVKTKNKSAFISYGYENNQANIYRKFTLADFRDCRQRNKTYLIREFSKDRIRTKFIDTKLFKTENYTIKGYLDSLYGAPLIFCKLSSDIFGEGTDIIITIVLKLFEQYKNVQIIFNSVNGLETSQIKSCMEFLEQNSAFDGKWLFIDGEINLPQFYASSDMAFLATRSNIFTPEHFISMKYGCVPVASRQGIYNDTIVDIFDDISDGCGFKTKSAKNTDQNIFENYYSTVLKALNLYTNNSASWNLLIKNAMNYNSNWTFEVIARYNEIYDRF